jgi:hypothetical protein
MKSKTKKQVYTYRGIRTCMLNAKVGCALAAVAKQAQKPQTIVQFLVVNAIRSSLICDVMLFSKQSWQYKCAAGLGHSTIS